MIFGNVKLKHGLFLAPMAGVTDRAFRNICRKYGAEYTFSEMISANAIHYKDKKTAFLAYFTEDEKPFSIQIFGSDPSIMAECAVLLKNNAYAHCGNTAFPDGIDINMGCPVNKIVSCGDGSALMKDPKRSGEIIKQVVGAVSGADSGDPKKHLPVSVKIRAGWDENAKNAVEMAKIAEYNGAEMITVHGRTRNQMYSGLADIEIIKQVKKAVSIPVVGNGDIKCAADAVEMYERTGVDGIMIGRGACGNPWIFSEIHAGIEGRIFEFPDLEERIETAKEHIKLMIEYKGERIALPEARKHVAWYIKGIKGSAYVRGKINESNTFEEMEYLLETLYEEGGKG